MYHLCRLHRYCLRSSLIHTHTHTQILVLSRCHTRHGMNVNGFICLLYFFLVSVFLYFCSFFIHLSIHSYVCLSMNLVRPLVVYPIQSNQIHMYMYSDVVLVSLVSEKMLYFSLYLVLLVIFVVLDKTHTKRTRKLVLLKQNDSTTNRVYRCHTSNVNYSTLVTDTTHTQTLPSTRVWWWWLRQSVKKNDRRPAFAYVPSSISLHKAVYEKAPLAFISRNTLNTMDFAKHSTT